MSKYLDADNPVDMAAVENNYTKKIKDAEVEAKERADYLLKEIRKYRSKSFEELKAERMRKDLRFGNPFLSSEDYYNSLSEEVRNRIIMNEVDDRLRDKKIGDSHYYNLSDEEQEKTQTEYFNKMTEEQKKSIIEKDRILNLKSIQDSIKEIKKKDLLYDMMTEEQVQKYVELYYISELKDLLYREKKSAIRKAENTLEKEDDIIPYNMERVATIKTLDKDDEKYKVAKKGQRSEIAGYLEHVGISSLATGGVAGILAGAGAAAIGEIFSDIMPILEYGGATAGVVAAAVATLTGISSIRQVMKDKKEIENLKKMGVYDQFVDYLKANKLYEDYEEELGKQYLPNDLESILEDAAKPEQLEKPKGVSL